MRCDQRGSREGYGTSSEYVRELIRRDKDLSQLRDMMLKGIASPVTGQADAAYFKNLRKGQNWGQTLMAQG